MSACGAIDEWKPNGCLTPGPSHVCARCYPQGRLQDMAHDDAVPRLDITMPLVCSKSGKRPHFCNDTELSTHVRVLCALELRMYILKNIQQVRVLCALELPSAVQVHSCLEPIERLNKRHYALSCLRNSVDCPNCDKLSAVLKGIWSSGEGPHSAI